MFAAGDLDLLENLHCSPVSLVGFEQEWGRKGKWEQRGGEGEGEGRDEPHEWPRDKLLTTFTPFIQLGKRSRNFNVHESSPWLVN